MQQPSRWKRLYSKSPYEWNEKLNEVSDINWDEECDQVLNELEQIMVTHTSEENNDTDSQHLLETFPSHSCYNAQTFIREDEMIKEIDLIIENNEEELELKFPIQLTFGQYEEMAEDSFDGAIFIADVKRNNWILHSSFHSWCGVTRDKKKKWKLISDILCNVLDRHLLHEILSKWKAQPLKTKITLQKHDIKKHRKIFNSWWNYTGEHRRTLSSWRHYQMKLISLKRWREQAEFFSRVRSQSLLMRSNRLIRSSFKYWRRACEISYSKFEEEEEEENKNTWDTVLVQRKTKDESMIKRKKHQVQSQSRLNNKSLAVDDKENRVNENDKVVTPKIKTTQRTITHRCYVIKPSVENKGIDTRQQKDEEERAAFLRKKKEEKMKRERKQLELESIKKAFRLAKIHKDISLLRMALYAFKVVMENRSFQECKADNFYHDMKLIQCFNVLRKNVWRRKSERLELSRRKFSMASSYYERRLCECVLRAWRHLAYRSHSVYFLNACERRVYSRKRDLVGFWIDALVRQRCHRISELSAARSRGEMIIRKFSFRQWKQRVDELVASRIEEEKIKEKWDMVRKWLSENEVTSIK